VALHEDDAARAAALFGESLEQFCAEGTERGIAEGLAGLACVATAQGEQLAAARLWGAAEAVRDAGNWGLWPPDQREYDRYLARARAAADADGFARAWQSGRQVGAAGLLAASVEALPDTLLARLPAA
jgi:hypothetical protein